MNRFIKKNLFLVGVLAISGAGILLLLGMSAVKFFEMNKYQNETKKMTDAFATLNSKYKTPIPPFRSNVLLVQKDTEGYKNLKNSIQSYFGQTLQLALTVFVADLRKQSMEKLISIAKLFDKNAELAKLENEFTSANTAWRKSLTESFRYDSEIKKAYKARKNIEDEEDTQDGKARAVANNQNNIIILTGKFDSAMADHKKKLADAYTAYNKLLTHIESAVSGANEETYKKWAEKNKDDAREFEFYKGICAQNITVEILIDTFRDFWNMVKDQQGPRKQTYRNFRLERGATLEQPANSKNKPVLWDTEMWNNALAEFVKEAQKSMLEKIDEKNVEEIFLSSLGLPRNLDKAAPLLEAYSAKMDELIKNTLEKGNVFATGLHFDLTKLDLIKSNKGFVDTGNTRNKAAAATNTGAGNNEYKPVLFNPADDPTDVIRNWSIIADLVQRMVTANIYSLEKLSYVNLAGDSSNSNYKKYTYVITFTSRESQIRTFLKLLSDACKENRMYVVKRFTMNKQEDQIQDIIDFASGIIGKENENKDKDNSGSGDNKNVSNQVSYFIENKKNYPECVAGRSTLCQATLVIDYVELTGNQLK